MDRRRPRENWRSARRFKAPRAYLGASSEPLPVKRNDNNLEINVKGRGDVRFVDSSVPAREDNETGGTTKTIYYAKAGRGETAAKLDLELGPTVANGNRLC
jgi:carbon monoxide dehydrogenase subunit G